MNSLSPYQTPPPKFVGPEQKDPQKRDQEWHLILVPSPDIKKIKRPLFSDQNQAPSPQLQLDDNLIEDISSSCPMPEPCGAKRAAERVLSVSLPQPKF